MKWRKQTFDVPLQIYCNLKQFFGALEEKSLPGGVKYNILTDKNDINIDEANGLMDKLKNTKPLIFQASLIVDKVVLLNVK